MKVLHTCLIFFFFSLLCFYLYIQFPTVALPIFHLPKQKRAKTISDDIKWIDQEEGSKFADYGDNTCGENKHRKHLVEIFQKWMNMSGINKLPYSLSTGTLLGAWRNGDVIPYDSDLDIMINAKDIEKLNRNKDKRNFDENDDKFHLILQEDWKLPYKDRRRFKCNGKKVARYSDECSFQEPLGRLIKSGYHIDIYDFKMEDNYIHELSEWEKKYPVSDVFPLRYCTFLGQITLCPNKPINILKLWYGEDLKPLKICKNGEWVNKKSS